MFAPAMLKSFRRLCLV